MTLNTLKDIKQPDYYSVSHEEVSDFEYVVIKLNSSERKYVEMWGVEITQYLYSQHKKGEVIAMTVLDASDMYYKMDNFHVITTLQVMSIANELGFTNFLIFNILPKKATSPLVKKAITSTARIVNTFAGKKYKFTVKFVDNINQARKKVLEAIEDYRGSLT